VVKAGRAFAIESTPIATNAQVFGGLITGQQGGNCLPLGQGGSFSNSSLGNSVAAFRGNKPGKGVTADLALLNNFNAGAGTLDVTADINQGGAASSFANVAGTYAVSSTGHTQVNFTDPNTGKQDTFTLYLDGNGNWYALIPDKSISLGFGEPQAAGPFNNSSIGGTYAFESEFIPEGATAVKSDEMTVDNTKLTLTASNGVSGGYAMDASGSGRGTATMTSGIPFGSKGAVLYVVNANRFVAMGTTATAPVVVLLIQ